MNNQSNDIPEGFRMTELGLLPEEWQVVPLSDVLIGINRRVANSRDINADKFPVLSLTKNYGLMLQSERFGKRIALEDVNDYKIVKRGEIVYNPYVIWEGAIHILDHFDYGLVSPVYPVLEANSECADPYFLDSFLRTPLAIAAYNRFAAGAVNRRRSIRKTDFMAIKVPLPSLPEQKEISRVLSIIQKAIESQDKIIAAARELKKSLMRHLFTYGPVSFLDAERVELKDTEIGSLPEQWEIVRLGDNFTLKQGKSLSPERRRGINPQPFLRTLNVLWGSIDLSTLDQMDFLERELEELRLVPGDLLVCEGGDIGRAAIWEGQLDLCFYQNHLHRLRSKSLDIYPLFYMYWLQAAILLFGLYGGEGNKTTIPNLSQSRLKSFLAPRPLPLEQKEIAHQLRTIDMKIGIEVNRKSALHTMFKTMVHQLLTGKIRVKDMEATAV